MPRKLQEHKIIFYVRRILEKKLKIMTFESMVKSTLFCEYDVWQKSERTKNKLLSIEKKYFLISALQSRLERMKTSDGLYTKRE